MSPSGAAAIRPDGAAAPAAGPGDHRDVLRGLDQIEVLDRASATITPDGSLVAGGARLWVEATLRKTALPLNDDSLAVSARMLAKALDYQQSAVRKALDPANLRPRILLADAVGLGKTLEIGMILAELVRRSPGERILIVSPRPRRREVLEQSGHPA